MEGEFQWDARNLEHAARHEVTPRLVLEVASGEPRLFPNEGIGRSGSHLMVGPDEGGRFWSIVLLRTGHSLWRPITGWPSTGSEIRLYNGGNV